LRANLLLGVAHVAVIRAEAAAGGLVPARAAALKVNQQSCRVGRAHEEGIRIALRANRAIRLDPVPAALQPGRRRQRGLRRNREHSQPDQQPAPQDPMAVNQ
jgi:hypothetical protein